MSCSVSTPRSVKSSVSYEGMVQIRDKNPAWRKGAQFTREEAEALISDERIPLDRRRPLRDPPDPRPAENPDLARPLRRREEGTSCVSVPTAATATSWRPTRRSTGRRSASRSRSCGWSAEDGEGHRATGRRASYKSSYSPEKKPATPRGLRVEAPGIGRRRSEERRV